MSSLRDHHDVAVARELAAACGLPLRDRYGYAARDEHVLRVLDVVAHDSNDVTAARMVGLINALGEIQLCRNVDEPLTEDEELELVTALRPVVEARRRAAERSLRDL